MDDILSFFSETIVSWYEIFINSTFFLILKLLLILYITILIVDIFLLIYLDGIRKRLRQQFIGTNIAIFSRKKKLKEWNLIKKRLTSEESNQYKVAILEADGLLDKFLTEAGYEGETVIDKVKSIPQHFSSNIDRVIESHNLRNEIIKNENLSVSKEDAEKNVDAMEKFLKTMDIL